MDNTYKVEIPEGFSQFAESSLSGTGGIRATAYHKNIENEKWILITMEDPSTSQDKHVSYIGPLLLRSITTLSHVIEDIMFFNKISV